MNLVVDAGNTRLKYAFFEGNQLMDAKYKSDELFQDIKKWQILKGPIDLLLSGSGYIPEDLRMALKESVNLCVEASPLMPLTLKIGYDTPMTLGFDRIAICTGAMSLFPGKPLLVIDSGTCITFNYVNAEGVFLGGNISPGLEIRFRGLKHFTAHLPLVEATENYGGMGRTTEEAIRNGVMDGMLFEVETYIRNFVENFEYGQVVITGGNSCFFEKRLSNCVSFCKMLGFIGLNEILEHVKNV